MKTMFEKVWEAHEVVPETPETPAVLYIDTHLVHEVTSPQAFSMLRQRGLKLRRADRMLATIDHSSPTRTAQIFGGEPITIESAAKQISQLERNCAEFGVELFGLRSAQRGIVHIIGPELGLTQPGATLVCGDSHTSTHGAFGALAFGIGTTEVGYVFATQCLLQRRAKSFALNVEGALGRGVTAKDLILYIIGQIGVSGGTGHVLEYRGAAIRALSMEERMTVCNMSIEGGARAGLIAPDDTTYQYLAGRPASPKGADWEKALGIWRKLPTDPGAKYDKTINIDANTLEPMITFGTNPGMGIGITQNVPDPSSISDLVERDTLGKALKYMDLPAGQSLLGHKVNVVFIGSCTNSRISDLRAAAGVFKGRKVSPNVRVMVVPGSQLVKQQAQAEGLDKIFKDAGADWREAGCSMCIAMNGDQLAPGEYSVSTSNRNFEGRQGKGGRTFLASPLTAAATAVTGVVTDVRTLL